MPEQGRLPGKTGPIEPFHNSHVHQPAPIVFDPLQPQAIEIRLIPNSLDPGQGIAPQGVKAGDLDLLFDEQ
jgi:hypothetical protein